MAISSTKYVDITSGVGGASVAQARELILRVFSINPLIPTNTILEFTTLQSVADYFGTDCEEYKRALQYFSYVSKLIQKPNKISFAFFASVDTSPLIYGGSISNTLAEFQAITDGAFQITLGGVLLSLTGLDFSTATSFSDIASSLQTAIRTGAGAIFTSATVSYDNASSAFNFVGGSTGAFDVIIQSGASGTDISEIIGWLPQRIGSSDIGAIWSDGVVAETITDLLTSSTNTSNNFGSFLFTNEAALVLSEIEEAAAWNDAQNVLYQYFVPVIASNANSYCTALADYSGCGATLDPQEVDQFPEQFPAQVLASTNYALSNSVQNYMYQQTGLEPSVTSTSVSDAYDALRLNYVGATQQAGSLIEFYQRGVLFGLSQDAVDMNIYANEQWFKDTMTVSLLNLQLALPQIGASAQGRAQIINTIQGVIDQALNNGVISTGKPLSSSQKAVIATITGDQNAWLQVQNSGYWFSCEIVFNQTSNEYEANYTVIYSKSDVVRKINGTHVLI